ncbi:MAG: metallophosphoesterase [Candidatus Micrarchaeota archaeon]
MVKFFFSSDLHGSEVVFNKLINAASFYNVKHIIVGGDLTGKILVPIVKDSNNIYKLNMFGEQKKVKEKELEDVKHELRAAGEYYTVMEKEEYEAVADNKEKMQELFLKEVISSLAQFIEKASNKLRPLGAKIYIMPGNDDFEQVADFLEKNANESVVSLDGKIVDIEGYEFLGYGYSNPTPWHTPREKEEDTIYKELKRLAEKVEQEKSVFVIHPPPIDTKIDKAPKLDSELRQEISAGYMNVVSAGSVSVRRIIEEYAPIAGFHGHIHESAGIDYIKAKNGRMVPVLNPGSAYSSGMLNGIIAEIEDGKLTKYNFTRG